MPHSPGNRSDHRFWGYALLLLAASLWALIGPVARFAFEEGVAPLEVAFWRAALAWILFSVHAAARRQMRVAPRHLPLIAVFGVVCIAIFYAAYQGAVEAGGAALASMLLYTAPAWVVLMAQVILGECATPRKILAVVLTLTGVAFIAQEGGGVLREGGVSGIAIALGLLSGFTYALYFIFGKSFLRHYSTPTLFLYALPVGALVLLPFVEFADKTPLAWLCVISVAVVSTYFAYLAYYAGLRHLDATRAAVVVTVEPVVAVLVAWWWWDERFGTMGLVGSVLILGSVLLVVTMRRST
ncbi:MAG: EamA/RhaT family transporter [Proteobacteria bacterium]|nr:MAG: EamA/RhaT family transporter [Pseudomonadota bacterium]QKK11871.1 MAG: EamA family transporter [Pseudomonadota bacterium]